MNGCFIWTPTINTTKMMIDQDYEDYITEQFLDENGNYWYDSETKETANKGNGAEKTSILASESTSIKLNEEANRAQFCSTDVSYLENLTDDGTSSYRDLSLHMLE